MRPRRNEAGQRVRRDRWPRVFLVTWVLIVAYETAFAVWALVLGRWAVGISYAIWAVLALGFAVLPERAYRAGWLDGRIAMLASMGEAQRRGMSEAEWLVAEMERDGIPVRRLPAEPDE